MRGLDVGERSQRAGFVELAFGGQLGERFGEVVARGADSSRVGVVEAHAQARERRDLRNAAAHRAAADNADSLDAEVARGHDVARLHGYFRIARSCNYSMVARRPPPLLGPAASPTEAMRRQR